MSRRLLVSRPWITASLTAIAVTLCGSGTALAQAWPLPARVGAVSFVYQDVMNDGHRAQDGTMVRGYDSMSRSMLFTFDYAFSDRLSVTFGLPYLGSKYEGPLPSFFLLPLDECHCWNHGWQDLGGAVRYTLVNGIVAVTPSISVNVPSNNYEYQGEAVLGMNLNEVRFGVDVGHRLARWPRLAVNAKYSYAVVEKVLDMSMNRSNVAIEPSYVVMRKLTAGGVFTWQRTHGGLRSTEFDTDEEIVQFDRLIRDNNFHIGFNVARSFRHFEVFGGYVSYVSGTDTHAGHALTFGISLPFER